MLQKRHLGSLGLLMRLVVAKHSRKTESFENVGNAAAVEKNVSILEMLMRCSKTNVE